MTSRSAEQAFPSEGMAVYAYLPIQGVAVAAQLWCWQLQALAEIASLMLAPWEAVAKDGSSGGGPLEKAAAHTLFDLAFCLGAVGEQHPFPD